MRRPFASSVAGLALIASLVPSLAAAQRAERAAAPASARPAEGGFYVTIFRNPSTGIEYRRGAFAAHGGYYPTILKADGQDEGENTNFVRLGASAYLRPSGASPYASLAFLVSLDDDWKNGLLSEVGVRLPFAQRFAGRLGVGVLTTTDGEVRVNPTVGFDVRLGNR